MRMLTKGVAALTLLAVALYGQTSAGGGLPLIHPDGVRNGASYEPVISSGALFSVFGSNFSELTIATANAHLTYNAVQGLRFFPVTLGNAQVLVNGKPAYLIFVSPTQINAQAPDDPAIGPVQIEVITPKGKAMSIVQKRHHAPAFITFDPENRKYIASIRGDGRIVAKKALFPFLPERQAAYPAKPEELLNLWGTGFGATQGLFPAGSITDGVSYAVATVKVFVGGILANYSPSQTGGSGVWLYVGRSPNSISGLYQLQFRVPALPNGDHPVIAEIDGIRSLSEVYITVQN